MSFSARELIQSSRAEFLLGSPHDRFEGVSIDTRSLRAGDIFFAIAGPHHDGHDHLQEAVEKGAAGLVVQALDDRVRFDREHPPAVFHVPDSISALQRWAEFLRTRSKATFVGITGSNGKTTTKEMTAAILNRAGRTLATRGNLNNHLGMPLTLSRLNGDEKFVVLEMGASRPGDIALLAKIGRPQISLVTNIGKAHLQGLGSQQGILDEKRAIFDALPADGVAVINQDDSFLAAAASSLKCKKIFYGLSTLADVRAEDITPEALAVRFSLIIRGQRSAVKLPLPGRFQVLNALAAAAVAHAAGIGLGDIVAGLNYFHPVAMRMQVIDHPSGAILINDAYNANPTSMRSSVESICEGYPDRARWLVLGDMRELGPNAKEEHRALGAWLKTQPLARIFLYGRDTRFVLEALQSVPTALRVQRFKKKRLLLAELQRDLSEKPVILFKGSRSMKLEDILTGLSGQAPGIH